MLNAILKNTLIVLALCLTHIALAGGEGGGGGGSSSGGGGKVVVGKGVFSKIHSGDMGGGRVTISTLGDGDGGGGPKLIGPSAIVRTHNDDYLLNFTEAIDLNVFIIEANSDEEILDIIVID